MTAAAGAAETNAAAGRVAGLGAGGVVASPGLSARLQDRPRLTVVAAPSPNATEDPVLHG